MIRSLLIALLLASPASAQTRVIDGDTIHHEGERIRIWGLDCPELRQPGGPEAKKALQNLLRGATVQLKRRGRDKYGRTVAIVFSGHPRGFQRDVARRMIASGNCVEFCRYSQGKYGTCR